MRRRSPGAARAAGREAPGCNEVGSSSPLPEVLLAQAQEPHLVVEHPRVEAGAPRRLAHPAAAALELGVEVAALERLDDVAAERRQRPFEPALEDAGERGELVAGGEAGRRRPAARRGVSQVRDHLRRVGAGRYLSTQVEDCDAAGNNCVLERSTYVSYERDTLSEPGEPGYVDANRRLLSSRIVYHDDGARYADSTNSSFDGLGHYRQVATNGNFDAGNVRTTFTDHNPGQGSYPGSFTMLLPSAPWLLETFTYQDQTEGGVTARVEACFDSANGFLKRTRRLKTGTAAGANDVVVLHTPDAAGNTIRDQYYGGDVQTLGTGALCSLALSGDQVRIDHGFQYGTLASSQYMTASGTAMSFKSLDRDVDLSTGLVKTDRDRTGLATGFEYDPLGRLTWETPPAGHDAWNEYTYTRATIPTALAKVAVKRRNGSKTAAIPTPAARGGSRRGPPRTSSTAASPTPSARAGCTTPWGR